MIKEIFLSGSEPKETTNNRMEMQAVIAALSELQMGEMAPITIRTDSQIVVKGMNEWIAGWQAKGWKGANKKPVANRDLWEQMLELSQGKTITWSWVKGHAGDPMNEKVDGLAEAAARAAMFTA